MGCSKTLGTQSAFLRASYLGGNALKRFRKFIESFFFFADWGINIDSIMPLLYSNRQFNYTPEIRSETEQKSDRHRFENQIKLCT